MSDQPSTAVSPVVRIGFSRPQDFRTLFTNNSRMRVAPGEVTLIFGYIDDIPNVGTNLTELVGIAMTPTHAKIMANVLTETLKLYEESYGAIPPPSATPLDPNKIDDIMKKAIQS